MILWLIHYSINTIFSLKQVSPFAVYTNRYAIQLALQGKSQDMK